MLLALLLTVAIVRGECKPYTLKVPMNAPIGGPINPMGAMCTEAVTLALDAINSKPDILPNYKLQIDMGDDQCLATAASRMALQFYENLKPMVPSARVFGNLTLPLRSNFSGDAYVPPLYLGGLCSPTCLTSSRMPQQYGFINVLVGCTEPQFTNRKLYSNFYRFAPSFVEVEKFRAKLMHYLGWNRMGYLADAVQTTYDDAIYFAKAILGAGKKVAAEEFYIDSPAESISRLKAADVRVIYANCYVNFCPSMACEAYRQGLYGPNIIWIFNSWIDPINGYLPPGCTKSMVMEFAEYSFYIGPDFLAGSQPRDYMTETGLTFKQFDDYMRTKIPDYENHPAFSWRLICFDDVVIGSRILHNAEMELNRRNESLKDIISDPLRKAELTALIRHHTEKVDANGLYGKSSFLPDSDESYNPPLIVEQYFKGERKTVLIARDRSIESVQKYFQTMTALKWGTRDGKSPRTEPLEAERNTHVDRKAIIGYIVATVVTLALKWLLQLIGLFFSTNFCVFNFLACLGSTTIAAAVLTFPLESDDLAKLGTFCSASPILAILGFSLMIGPLVLKLWGARYVVEERNSRFYGAMLVIWLVINVCLLEGWYIGEYSPVAIARAETKYDEFTDTIWNEYSYLCSFSSEITSPKVPYGLVGMQAFLLLAAIILAIGSTKKRGRRNASGRTTYRSRTRAMTKARVASTSNFPTTGDDSQDSQVNQDVKDTSMTICMLSSLLMLCAFALAVFIKTPNGLIANLTTFSLACSLGMTFLLQRKTITTLLFRLGFDSFDPGLDPMARAPSAVGGQLHGGLPSIQLAHVESSVYSNKDQTILAS